MIRNYLSTAIRQLLRKKAYSFINITGLAIGMAIAFLIFLWVMHELSFDRFNVKADRIHRLVQTQYYSTGPLTTTCMPGPIAKDIKADIPEITNSFMYYVIPMNLRCGDHVFTERIRLADPELFEIFTFEFLQGDPQTVFNELHSTVITDKMAKKLFQDEDPIGKVIELNKEHSFRITGVIKETPENSSFRFDVCIPFEFIDKLGYSTDRYGGNTYYVYVELADNADYRDVNIKIKKYLQEKSKSGDEDDSNIDLFLFPLEKFHLYSFSDQRGDIQYVYLFSAIAIFILVIACINFMNLSTARSARRSREIAIRKVSGAQRKELILQFLGESVILSFIALILAIILAALLLPYFNELVGSELAFNPATPEFWLMLIGITVFAGLLAGSYPALYLSSFMPALGLKNGSYRGKGNSWFRRVLVVFQFVLSVGLIISTIVVQRQLSFVINNKLGMDISNVEYQAMRGEASKRYDVLRNELMQNPLILDVTRAESLPFMIGSNSGGFDWEGRNTKDDILVGFGITDAHYPQTLGIKMVAGRYYNPDIQGDTAAIVINKKAADVFGMDDPVSKWVSWGNNRFTIIGVIDDFHFLPMQYSIDPIVLVYGPETCHLAMIKTDGNQVEKANAYIQETWKKVFPEFPYEKKNLEVDYRELYTDEANLIRVIGYFALLAIVISCLGLYGLAAYMTEQRTKEIGIRKILGAKTSGIVAMVSKEFTIWVLVANLIAWPVAWLAMDDWLSTYAYHTKLTPGIFILALAVSLVIALLTVSWQSVRSAMKKPVEAVKYE
ncbi:MAG: ABC transporter permease [Bacteroidales bacterium]|nr:ABC transporter permease [Bacteroidales bacterium]